MIHRFLALYGVLTAAALLYLVSRIVGAAAPSSVIIILTAAFLLLALAAILAAVATWRQSPWGIWLTLLVQALQVPQLATGALTYLVSLPFSAVLGVTLPFGLHWHAGWRPGLEITPDGYQSAPWIGINLWALLAVGLAAAILRTAPNLSLPPSTESPVESSP